MGATPPGALLAIGIAAPPTASVHSSSQHASTRVLSPVLDTDDGLGDRHRGVRRGWWDSADDLHHHRAEEPGGAAERQVAALWRLLVHRRDDGSVFVGMVVTVAAENSLPDTRIDPFPEPAW